MKKQNIQTTKPFTVFSMEADTDYIVARLVNFAGPAVATRAGYFSQQALEKYLKAYLVQEKSEYPKIHSLIGLAKQCSKLSPDFSDPDFIRKIEIFNDFTEVGRYGGEASYDPHAMSTDNITTAGAMTWSDSNIKILDELVYEIRDKLIFPAELSGMDYLNEIVVRNKASFIFAQWKLPIDITALLTTQNDFFKPRDIS